ncbi:ABC transporter permease [Clostridium saccharobutylicum]|uniref:ABC-2 family transporter protein n=1 Tax=Clostridium saccharobutylicum TaxID=169679 RepID=A0A1S8NHW5_CLOSA|nr:ABC transporter permease [Clostridium saccharobutylicum]OOM16069.1 ABC-2 family transporter protein [Clostridium saccharobutylicum]
MNNLIRGEFYKLKKSKYFVWMIVFVMILGFFLMMQWDTDDSRLQDVHQEFMNGLYAIEYSFQYLIVTSFMFALLAEEFIVKDLKNGNMCKSFCYGYRRSKIILSKLIVFIIFCLFLELIYTSILAIYVSYNRGFYEVLNLKIALYFARVIVLGMMYILATICIIAMIAILTKSNVWTIISPILLLISYQIVRLNLGITVSNIFSYIPHIAGSKAIGMFSSNTAIIKSTISSVATLVITIGAILIYVKNEDIR